MNTKNIGLLLKTKRTEKNLTMKQVADFVNVSESTISRWESGEIKNMKRDKIAKLSDILGIDPALIMGWDDESTTKGPAEADPVTTKIIDSVMNMSDLQKMELLDFLDLQAKRELRASQNQSTD